MHAKHVENLKTILDSIKHARWNREEMIIGNTVYGLDEMYSVQLVIEAQLLLEAAETKKTDG